MKKLLVGNWKMNGTLQSAKTLIANTVNTLYENQGLLDRFEFVVCPPFLHLYAIRHALRTINYLEIGSQDCSSRDDGAFTGDTSARMLADSGCRYVILGHSERRENHQETDIEVTSKAFKAHENGLVTIICVGESLEQRERGQQAGVVGQQLENCLPASVKASNTIIAYEPVWAIGTGKVATPQEIKDMHLYIRQYLDTRIDGAKGVRILYGGSLKPENAQSVLSTPHVDGGLIGGASLNADQFLGIALRA